MYEFPKNFWTKWNSLNSIFHDHLKTLSHIQICVLYFLVFKLVTSKDLSILFICNLLIWELTSSSWEFLWEVSLTTLSFLLYLPHPQSSCDRDSHCTWSVKNWTRITCLLYPVPLTMSSPLLWDSISPCCLLHNVQWSPIKMYMRHLNIYGEPENIAHKKSF